MDEDRSVRRRIASGSDKEEPDFEVVSVSTMLFKSYWDTAYAKELANFLEHGHPGKVWFGTDVMESVACWTKNLCIRHKNKRDLSGWSVLDIGTGNGLLLQELAKQGFSDLTGSDYSGGAIDLARRLADRNGFHNIKFLVDDVLDTKLGRKFQFVTDKGTLDALPWRVDEPWIRMTYWDRLATLVAPGGLLVITSCNSTKNDLITEMDMCNVWRERLIDEIVMTGMRNSTIEVGTIFEYFDHMPTSTSGGSRVATVAFLRL